MVLCAALRCSHAAGSGLPSARREVGMTHVRVRSLSAVFLAVVCVAVLGMTSMLRSAITSGVRALMAEVALIANDGWIMGGTGNPIPDQNYLNSVEGLYLSQYSGYNFDGLETPEQFCPIICS